MREGFTPDSTEKDKTTSIPIIDPDIHPDSKSRVYCPVLGANCLIFSSSTQAEVEWACQSFGLKAEINSDPTIVGDLVAICRRFPKCGRLVIRLGKPNPS